MNMKGMKHLPLVILLATLALVAVVTGCRGEVRYDARLTAADSLLDVAPDSALALVEALDSAALATPGDRAYRDLLLTQARYKCYITATTDSAINRALAYYRAHGDEREKLTRTYIYKGAVMEELGHPDSAMLYYKHAEATAAPDDYFNLGYTKMRMGALYRDNLEMGGKHIIKYEEALECLQHTNESHYQQICMINLGSLYCLKNPQRADSLLNLALTLSEYDKDTSNYVYAAQNLMKMYLNQERYEMAYSIVQKVFQQNSSVTSISFCLYSALTYAHLNKPDSAQMFIDMLKDTPITNAIDSLTLLETKRDIALAHGDINSFEKLDGKCRIMSLALQSAEKPIIILKTEDDIENHSKQASRESQQFATFWAKALLILSAIVTIICFLLWKQKNRQEKLYREILDSAESQVEELEQLQLKLVQHNINDEILKSLLVSHMEMMKDVMDECYHYGNNFQSQKIKNILQFQNSNKDKWFKLFGYLDLEYDGIISKTQSNYPSLSNKDLLLIAMTTLDFSYIQTAIVLGYNNATTISSMKQRLAKKMGLDYSLNEYISHFKH